MEYNITRHNHYQDFTILPNDLVKDDRLSFGASGLLCFLLSLPSEWNVSVRSIAQTRHITERRVLDYLKELIEFGYCQRSPRRVDGKMNGQRYEITDIPFDFSAPTKNGGTEIPAPQIFRPTEIPAPRKNGGTYKEQSIVEKEQNIIEKEQREGAAVAAATPQGAGAPVLKDKANKFQAPTLDEIKAFCRDRGYTIDALQFFAHYESCGWKVGRNPMKNWKAAVVNWYCRDRKEGKKATTTPIPAPAPAPKTEAAAPKKRNPNDWTDAEYADYLKYRDWAEKDRAQKEEQRRQEEERKAAMPARERMRTFRLTQK